MTKVTDTPNRAKAIFLEAVESESDESRDRFLDEACAGDAALRAKVDELLVALGRRG